MPDNYLMHEGYYLKHPENFSDDELLDVAGKFKAWVLDTQIGSGDPQTFGAPTIEQDTGKEDIPGLTDVIGGIIGGKIAASDVAKGLYTAITNLHETLPDWAQDLKAEDPEKQIGAINNALTMLLGPTPGAKVGGRSVMGSFVDPARMGLQMSKEEWTNVYKLHLDAARRKNPDIPEDKLKGIARDKAWQSTGIELTPGGRLVAELSDDLSKFTSDIEKYLDNFNKGANWEKYIREKISSKATTLGEAFDHPGLYALYPELKDVKIIFSPRKKGVKDGVSGEYDPILRRIKLYGNTKEDALSTILHEVTHAVQDIDQRAFGGSSTDITTRITSTLQIERDELFYGIQDLLDEKGLRSSLKTWHQQTTNIPDSLADSLKLWAKEKGIVDKDIGQLVRELEAVDKNINKFLDFVAGKDPSTVGKDLYRALFGEIQARNVSRRHKDHPFMKNALENNPVATPDDLRRKVAPRHSADVDYTIKPTIAMPIKHKDATSAASMDPDVFKAGLESQLAVMKAAGDPYYEINKKLVKHQTLEPVEDVFTMSATKIGKSHKMGAFWEGQYDISGLPVDDIGRIRPDWYDVVPKQKGHDAAYAKTIVHDDKLELKAWAEVAKKEKELGFKLDLDTENNLFEQELAKLKKKESNAAKSVDETFVDRRKKQQHETIVNQKEIEARAEYFADKTGAKYRSPQWYKAFREAKDTLTKDLKSSKGSGTLLNFPKKPDK